MPTQTITSPTLAEADILSDVYDLLAYVCDNVPIIRGNQSREVLPSDDDFIIYTPLYKKRVGTNIRTFNAKGVPDPVNGSYNDKALFMVDIQVDCFGENASNYATMINLFAHSIVCRDWLVNQQSNIRVAQCSDPTQIDFIDDTRQYCSRYMVTLSICFDSALIMGIPWFEDVKFKGTKIDPETGKLTPPSRSGLVNVDVFFKP
jgi:hypothetical protein